MDVKESVQENQNYDNKIQFITPFNPFNFNPSYPPFF